VGTVPGPSVNALCGHGLCHQLCGFSRGVCGSSTANMCCGHGFGPKHKLLIKRLRAASERRVVANFVVMCGRMLVSVSSRWRGLPGCASHAEGSRLDTSAGADGGHHQRRCGPEAPCLESARGAGTGHLWNGGGDTLAATWFRFEYAFGTGGCIENDGVTPE